MPLSIGNYSINRFYVLVGVIVSATVITTNIARLKTLSEQRPYFKFEHIVVPKSADACKLNRTLVIVNGGVRTLVHLWEALLLNIVQPNEPCDIIFSIDGKREEIPEAVIAGLGTRIIAILTTENEKPDGLTEFWLMKRTIRKIHFDRYRFIIKTRTDLYHGVALPLKTVFGEADDFIVSFFTFHQTFMNKTAQTNVSAGEMLYAWMMTGGMVEFIRPMLIKKPYSPWSKLHQHDWNKNLKSTLIECSTTEKLVMKSGNPKNDEKISCCFSMALQRYKVVYNIGSTWMQFGHSQHIIPTALKIAEEFGRHTWADVGFDDRNTKNQWKDVTESQMRLTFLKAGYNLIDLVNSHDFVQTFIPNNTFRQAKLDKKFLFFVVRGHTIA
jgi:hypothetical protein